MNLCIGMIVKNEAPMLRLTLPVYSGISAIKMALDFGSTDGTQQILRDHGWAVMSDVWRNDYAAARNELLDRAEEAKLSGFMLQLDADECMYPSAIEAITEECPSSDWPRALPRYNYVRGELFESESYPDHQTRLVRVGSGVKWERRVHEIIGHQHIKSLEHIHHYGWAKSPQENWLRSHNYKLIAFGKPTITADEIPDDIKKITYGEWLMDMADRHKFSPVTHDHPLKGHVWK
jgi:hypothetical protein